MLSDQKANSYKVDLDNMTAKLENKSNELLIVKTQYDKSLKEFNNECDKLKKELTLTNKELESKKNELSSLNKGFSQKRDELQEKLEEKTLELAKVQNSFESTRALFEEELSKLRTENEDLQDQETKLSAEIIDLQAENKQYRLELEQARSASESTSGQLAGEIEKLREEYGRELEVLTVGNTDLKARVEASECEKKQMLEKMTETEGNLKMSLEEVEKYRAMVQAKENERQQVEVSFRIILSSKAQNPF